MASPSSANPDFSGTIGSQRRVNEHASALELLRNSLDAAICIDSSGKILLWNPVAETLLGWAPVEALGRPLAELVIPEGSRDAAWAPIKRSIDAGPDNFIAQRLEFEAARKDGSQIPVELSVSAVSGDSPMFVVILRNLSRQRALEADSAQLAAIIESSPMSLILMDLDGRVTGWSPGAEALTGYSEAEALGRTTSFLTPPGYKEDVREYVDALSRGESVVGHETKSLCKDGTVIDISLTVYPVRDATGTVVGLAGTSIDITDRKRAEAAVLSSRERFKQLFDLLPMPVVLSSLPGGEIFEANKEFFDSTGLTPDSAYGRTDSGWLVLDGQGQALVDELAKTGRFAAREIVMRARDGGKRTVLVSAMATEIDGNPAGLWTMLDISDQRLLEEQVSQFADLDVVGRLATGVAHDINNLLTVILGQAELLLIDADPGSGIHDSLSEVRDAANASANLTRHLLSIGGRQPLSLVTVQLNEVVQDMQRILRASLGATIRYTSAAPAELWPIRADPVHIRRILMNLVVNAKSAMPDGETLSITCDNVELDDDTLEGPPPGRYVRLRVTDNGSGMDQETQANLFEPYFTKTAGGTGLGLTTVRGIIVKSGGHISVSSELGQGSEFSLLFPRLETSPG